MMHGGEQGASAWSCATNWTVAEAEAEAEGSPLQASISVDTSASDDAPACRGSLLLPPASLPDPPPCEVTGQIHSLLLLDYFFYHTTLTELSFSSSVLLPSKHEIHQVYARTTARIFEIYTAKDHTHSNEYLCTVKCGPAASPDTTTQEDTWVHVNPPPSPFKAIFPFTTLYYFSSLRFK